MTAKHTPGEWEIVSPDIIDRTIIRMSDGCEISFGESDQSLEEIQANARLIAAAPSMYDDLNLIAHTNLDYHPEYKVTINTAGWYKKQLEGVIELAEAAIRKARGE